MKYTEKQPDQIRLNTGMNQEFGTRGAPPGTLYLVKNCRLLNGGLQKRCGTAAFASTNTGFTVQRPIADTSGYSRPTEKSAFVGRIGNQKLAGNSAGFAFTHDGTNFRFSGEFSAAQPVRKRLGIPPSLPTAPLGPYTPAVAVNASGYVCTAAGFGSELRITVESPNGELMSSTSEALGSTNIVVRVVATSSTSFLVVAQSTGSTTVATRIRTLTNGSVTNALGSTLATLNNAASCWDLSAYDGTTWFFVYQSGATTVTAVEYTGTTAGSTATFSTTDNLTYLSVWADPVTDRVWIGLVDDPLGTPAPAYRIYTDALVLSVGPTAIGSTSGSVGPPLFGPLYTRSPVAGDAFGVFADISSLGGNNHRFMQTLVVQSGVVTRQQAAIGNGGSVAPLSKPDTQQRVWVMTYVPDANFTITKVMLLRFVGAELIGESSFDPTPIIELASPDMENPGDTYHPAVEMASGFAAVAVTSEAAGGKAYFAFPFTLTTRTNAAGATEPTTRVDVYEYTRYNQEPHRQMVPLGLSAVVSGQPTELFGIMGVTSVDPNHGGVEIGFAHAPTIMDATATPSGSGLAAGTYVYYALQQWVDDEGNRHLSAPSAPLTVTLAVPSSVAFEISNCYAGQRPNNFNPIATRSPVTLLYRTQNGGTEAQLVPVACTESSANWVGYVDATDTVADSIIDDNEFIYTAGGVLPNVLAPSCRYLAVSEDRLWCGGLWDSNIIECSKIRVPGEPYNFTGDASHQVVIPGEVSGLAYQDGQVCVFTEDAIYLVSGDGPNDQGAGGFAPPRALVRGVGCPRKQSASILETELGIFFRSALGFYLIPRGFGTPEYIGGPVHNEDSVVLSAATTTTDTYRLARFLVCAEGETKSDTVLVFDLEDKVWVGRDTYTVDGSTFTGQGFSEIGEWPDGLALLSYGLDRADNPSILWAEDEDLTGDAGATGAGATTYITQYIQTAWMQMAGPLGQVRLTAVTLSCEPIGSSTALTMTIETDANADDPATWTLTTSEEAAYRSIPVKEPGCTEFRVTLSDAAGAANSAGVRFLGLGFETQAVPGIRRVTDSQGN